MAILMAMSNIFERRDGSGELYIQAERDHSWTRFRPMTRGRYVIEALAWIAIGVLAGVVVMAFVGCGTMTPPAPDAELPACPMTCTGLCHANGQCTCDGAACQREAGKFPDAGPNLGSDRDDRDDPDHGPNLLP